jgi:hypothetical protein
MLLASESGAGILDVLLAEPNEFLVGWLPARRARTCYGCLVSVKPPANSRPQSRKSGSHSTACPS